MSSENENLLAVKTQNTYIQQNLFICVLKVTAKEATVQRAHCVACSPREVPMRRRKRSARRNHIQEPRSVPNPAGFDEDDPTYCFSTMCFMKPHERVCEPGIVASVHQECKLQLDREIEESDPNTCSKQTLLLKELSRRRRSRCGVPAPGLGVYPIIFHMDVPHFRCYLRELRRSKSFRKNFTMLFFPRFVEMYFLPPGFRGKSVTVITVVPSLIYEQIDEVGCDLANSIVTRKKNIENALSWLSTLGGAFSALGDNSVSFAKEAGKVSWKQWQLAIKLDDPLVTSRCRLYGALSLMQRGFLKMAKDIVLREYEFAMKLPSNLDPKLPRMCKGVWAKLQYLWKKRAQEKKLTVGLRHD